MRRRFDKQGALLLRPQAFLDLFVAADEAMMGNESRDVCEIVSIRGPLVHHDDWWCDSYEAILDRVAAACESPSRTVILKIDSPGGDYNGCFDLSRAIRARAKAAGKKLIAYVEGDACSAGYAIACAAGEIVTSASAFLGSIGVIVTRVDQTARDAAMGLGFAIVASGARKLDANQHVSLTKEELTAMQTRCEAMASLFFELVADCRRGLSVEAIAALEADIFHGAAAVEAGLADRVASFDELLASLTTGGTMEDEERDDEAAAGSDDGEGKGEGEGEAEEEREASAADVDDARAALQRAADDGDEKAARALAVLNEDAEESDDDDSEGEGASRAASRGAPARRPAGRVSADSAAQLARTVDTLTRKIARIEADADQNRMKALLSSRPDLSKELAAELATLSYADARKIIARMPKRTAARGTTGTVAPATRGKGEGERDPSAPTVDAESESMRRAFGLSGGNGGVRREGRSLVFGVPLRRADRFAAKPTTTATTTTTTEAAGAGSKG